MKGRSAAIRCAQLLEPQHFRNSPAAVSAETELRRSRFVCKFVDIYSAALEASVKALRWGRGQAKRRPRSSVAQSHAFPPIWISSDRPKTWQLVGKATHATLERGRRFARPLPHLRACARTHQSPGRIWRRKFESRDQIQSMVPYTRKRLTPPSGKILNRRCETVPDSNSSS